MTNQRLILVKFFNLLEICDMSNIRVFISNKRRYFLTFFCILIIDDFTERLRFLLFPIKSLF